ncbi:MAG: Rrf2 family transcriptional regulator [Bryobacteraceae bacterium]|nr:Rrf2 family transcriptional regulator [Bryobacteraceae bacterium]
MRISGKGQYALHAIFDLTLEGNSRPVRIADIARRQKIPQKFLELILASLKQGGFVESRRGADGGYLLARDPKMLPVGEVLRYVEGGDRTSKRGKRAETPFSALWLRVDQAVSGVIDQTTFADLAQAWREREERYVPNWDI